MSPPPPPVGPCERTEEFKGIKNETRRKSCLILLFLLRHLRFEQENDISILTEQEQNLILTFSGSLFKQVSTNSLNCLEKFPVNWGGLFFGIRKRTLMGWRSELGGSPLANSMAVIPKLHTSAFASYAEIKEFLSDHRFKEGYV